MSEAEELRFSVAAENRSEQTMQGEVTLDLVGQREEVSLHLSRPISLLVREKATVEFPVRLSEPDFYEALAQLRNDG